MMPVFIDSPLRRSEVGILRGSTYNNVAVNDDEEERRQARRHTLLQNNSTLEHSTFEESETLKKCLEIYNGNKLSRDNAWSLSLIDTLSALLDRHHKSLNNFKVAGSSLEASSKVYGLRVDSIHIDVLRMSAGLNAQKFNEKELVGNEDITACDQDGNDGDSGPPGLEVSDRSDVARKATLQKNKGKRQRKIISTVTRNKDTLNARLDTVPLQDPIFGKLNSTVGSINSSNRLMNNILITTESELRLCTNFNTWNSVPILRCDYTEEVPITEICNTVFAQCDCLLKVHFLEEIKFRPLHCGYVLSESPGVLVDNKEDSNDGVLHRLSSHFDLNCSPNGSGCENGNDGEDVRNISFHKANELAMAFDINAECEPIPILTEYIPIVHVDYTDLTDLTTEERTAINNCRALRKVPVLIEDLRPVDANSELEYSYRPLDKISQFWAGPSHWKFKRVRTLPSTLSVQQSDSNIGRIVNQRVRRNAQLLVKKRSKQVKFGEFHDELFIKLDDKFKNRRVNIQKKWDQRKLKLPIDMQVDTNRFYCFALAPGLAIRCSGESEDAMLHSDIINDLRIIGQNNADCIQADDNFSSDIDNELLTENNLLNNSSVTMTKDKDSTESASVSSQVCKDTVIEITTHFEGAPNQITKILVPFAKRAKVIDMKNLKRSCTALLTKQLKQHVPEEEITKYIAHKGEQYSEGVASFQEIYKHLPEMLTQNMSEALSTSVAFYSLLHLANEYELRLIQQDDLKDFKIRKVVV